jgi:hypothetical protein
MFVIKVYNDLNQNDSKIIPNNKIKIALKEHQKTAIYAMLDFEKNRKVSYIKKGIINNYKILTNQNNQLKDIHIEIESNYGILADKVGSGKTYMIMSLICHQQIPSPKPIILNSSTYTITKYTDTQQSIKTNLIIVPHNLTMQWKEAFLNCSLKTYIISKKSEINYLDNSSDKINYVGNFDCIIISATMIREFFDSPYILQLSGANHNNQVYSKFSDIKWARIIIDEVISIQIPSMINFNSNFIWFLTATPSEIKYIKRLYIKVLTESITDETLNNIIIKNNDNYVDDSMKLPHINKIIIKCLTPKELNILKNYVDKEIITMINAGNIEGAIKKLNCNIDTTENIIEVLTRKIKIELFNTKEELKYEEIRIHDTPKIKEERITKLNEQIKELELKYTGIEDRIKDDSKNDCPICYNLLNKPIITHCCNNLFCIECLIKCSKCPLCRTKILINKCTVINENKIISTEQLYSKIDNLIKLIKLKPNRKILLFSEYDKTFDNLNEVLNNNNITHSRLVGSCCAIKNIINKFDAGEINILMLNAVNYGSGLNLQMATDIIIYHELKNELETQVIGRAQRLGRKDSLNVYYLFSENEDINTL